MDSGTRFDKGYMVPEPPVFASDGGGIFSGSQHFIVAGGIFNNITNYVTCSVPSDIRMIPMGDIDLQQQLRMNKDSGVVSWRGEINGVRRVYSAKIDGRTSDMTVAVYQGDRAEEDWRRNIEQYSSLRHPNILQVWGGASAGNIYATVFHGDLVPFKQFAARYAHSHIMTGYIAAYYGAEWHNVYRYLLDIESNLLVFSTRHFTLWARCSTGRLFVDLEPPDSNDEVELYNHHRLPPSTGSTNILVGADPEAAINSLTLQQYHLICWTLARNRIKTVSSCAVSPGSVISVAPLDESWNCVALASLPANLRCQNSWGLNQQKGRGNLEDGWTWSRAEDISDTELYYSLQYDDAEAWLSQANHIFHRHQITSHLDNYVLVRHVSFQLMIPTIKEGAPPGYLFLCPQKAFETGPFLYKLPDCPAYWSLDPLGVECLSAEDATSLGFPAIQLSVVLEGHSWDDSVYVGLRQFHQAKGFDPESQDIARHLGNPLYQVSSGRVNDEDSLTEVDDNLQALEEDALAVVSDEEVDEPASIHDGGTEVNEPMTIYDGDQEFNEQPSVHDIGEEADGRTRIHDEDSPVSQALKLTVSVQSILILFVILCSMYDVIW